MDEFEVIYSKYSPLVFRYLLSLGGDFTSAEEITAETFYRLSMRNLYANTPI